jgi:hypothetical protein
MEGYQEAFHIGMFVKAIKGKPFTGYARIPVPGAMRRLDESTKEKVFEWFAARARDVFLANQDYLLVPIPSSSCTSAKAVRASRLAQLPTALFRACRGQGPLVMWSPLLWWKVAKESAHKTRDKKLRDAWKLYGNLAVGSLTTFARKAKVVLVDDVCTTGAHFRAAEARLRERGLNVVGGLCVACTVLEQPENAFRRVAYQFDRLDFDDQPY